MLLVRHDAVRHRLFPPRLPLLLPLLALLFLLGLAVLAAPVAAQGRAVEPIAVSQSLQHLSLQGRYELLEDPQRRHTPETLLQDAAQWQAASAQPLNLGHSDAAWWLRLRLRSTEEAHHLQRLLQVDNPRVDHLEVFLVREGVITQRFHTGDRLPFASRPVPHHAFVFPIDLRPGESVDVLLRVDSHDGYFMLLPLSLLSERQLQADTQRHTLLMGLYYGGLGLLLLYHLCVLGGSRDPSFAVYVAYLAALIVCRVHFEGHAAQYWFPEHPWAVNQVLLVAYSASVVLFGALMVLNLREFLAQRPRLRRLCWVMVVVNAVPIPMALAGHYAAALKLINPATFFSILFALGMSAAAWRSGWRHTRWFLLGSAFVLLGLMAERLRLASVLPDHPLFAYSMAIGSVLEALCLAVALADAVNRLKADKLAAEQMARQAQSRLNEQLGHLVQERTEALQTANERLSRLAITDELTGAFNRRHFEQELGQALAQSQRGGGAIGLCLFDLDHFKGYNDRYGHPAGDEVLRCVTLVVQSTAKRTCDQLFRIGGEEFALLMPGRDCESLARFVEQIRAEVERLALPHAGNGPGVVTASFGLAWVPSAAGDAGNGSSGVPAKKPAVAADTAHADAAALYRFADQLLYRAKDSGRNRVVVATFTPPGVQAEPLAALAALH